MSHMRACKVCGEPAWEFCRRLLCEAHFKQERADFQRRPVARAAAAENARRRYAADPSVARDRSRRWREKHRAMDALKRGAASYVRWAVAVGLLVRPEQCERCEYAGSHIEAAHADYNAPLEVQWLCRSCHRLWDRTDAKLPKLGMRVVAALARSHE